MCVWTYSFVLAPCVDLQVVRITKLHKTVIPLYTRSVTRQSCPPSVVPRRVESYAGTALYVSLLVHLPACPPGLLVWGCRSVLFLWNTQARLLFSVASLEMANELNVAPGNFPLQWPGGVDAHMADVCFCGVESMSPLMLNKKSILFYSIYFLKLPENLINVSASLCPLVL